MPTDDRDDGIPIRRHSKKPGPNRTLVYALAGVGVLLVVAVAVFVAVASGKRGGAGSPSVAFTDPIQYPEGYELLRKHKWWTGGATAAKVQAIIDDLTSASHVTLLVNSEADYTTFHKMSSWEIAGLEINRDSLMKLAKRAPDEFSNPAVLATADRFQFKEVRMVRFGTGVRATTKEAENALDDFVRMKSPVENTGVPAKR